MHLVAFRSDAIAIGTVMFLWRSFVILFVDMYGIALFFMLLTYLNQSLV